VRLPQRNFGFFVRLIVGDDSGGVRVQQQRFGVRGLLVDLHAHVVERADNAVDRRRLREVVRQVVVDLRVGQVALLLAQLDERAHLALTLFSLLRRQLGRHGDRFARALALRRAARRSLRVGGGFVLRIFAIKRVHVFSSRGFAMRRKTRPSGVSSMAQHHLSDSTRLYGCVLWGAKKMSPLGAGR